MTTISEVDHDIQTHIEVCAIRYEGILNQIDGVNARLKRIEQIMIGCAGAIIFLLLGIAVQIH